MDVYLSFNVEFSVLLHVINANVMLTLFQNDFGKLIQMTKLFFSIYLFAFFFNYNHYYLFMDVCMYVCVLFPDN